MLSTVHGHRSASVTVSPPERTPDESCRYTDRVVKRPARSITLASEQRLSLDKRVVATKAVGDVDICVAVVAPLCTVQQVAVLVRSPPLEIE